jgi:Lon-like protease
MHEQPDQTLRLPPPPSRGRRIAVWLLSGLGVVVIVAAVAGFLVHLPYVVISPGSATALDDSVITVEGAPTYPHNGTVEYLTVRVSGSDPNLWKLLFSWLDSDSVIEKRANVVGCLSDAENLSFNTRLMEQSQDDATKVALERLGYTVTAAPPEVVITEIRARGDGCGGAPASGILRAGDRVVSIDEQPVVAADDVRRLLDARRPDDVVRITVLRDGTTETLEVVAGSRSAVGAECVTQGGAPEERAAGKACLGIVVQTFVQYVFPIDVQFDLARVGGPSAGLAFTLAIIDTLTPGDLTGGTRVATTGAIAADGTVGVVGGVEQKAIAAREDGVQLVLVPRAEVAAAREGADGLRVVGVRTLDDALIALQEAGGTPVPPPTSTPARS